MFQDRSEYETCQKKPLSQREEDSTSNEKAIKEQEVNNLDGAEVEACDRVVVVGEQNILLGTSCVLR